MKSLATRRWWPALVWLGLMLLMGSWYVQKAVPDLWQRACWLGEWPFEQGCETQVFRNDPEALPEAFAQHLQAHVGDAHAWTGLTAALWLREDPSTSEALQAAQLLAPYNTVVLLARADKALNTRDWPTAAQTLVALVERGHAPARPSLQALMLHPEGQRAVLDQVQPGQQWLDALLASLPPETHPAQVLPLVELGMQLSLLKPGTVLGLVDRLKRVNHFADAYTLWVAQRGQVPLGVFNGDFETRALRRAFDWQERHAGAASLGLAGPWAVAQGGDDRFGGFACAHGVAGGVVAGPVLPVARALHDRHPALARGAGLGLALCPRGGALGQHRAFGGHAPALGDIQPGLQGAPSLRRGGAPATGDPCGLGGACGHDRHPLF